MSILGSRLHGARVLDLFAGTGALGLEALSRGAATATFVENAPDALGLLRQNISALELQPRATVIQADVLPFVRGLTEGGWDLALADPPYAADYAELLIAAFRAVPFAGLLAVEHSARRHLTGDDTRRYGDTAITFCYPP
jgi:16S rRNA (guanine966-N2)-methyltransferase